MAKSTAGDNSVIPVKITLSHYIPEPLARGYKTHEFHKYRMK